MLAGIDGELIRKLRTAKSWSQEELGQISGLSARTVQRIETEGGGSLESRRALASAFGLKPEDLLANQPVSGPPAEDDQAHVDHPRIGALHGAILWGAVVVSVVGLTVVIIALGVQISSHRKPPIPVGWLWLVAQMLLVGAAYLLWITANTSYRLSAQGLQVRQGPHRRNYRWDDLVGCWRSSIVPLRLSWQPTTRFSDVVVLETRAGGKRLDLTPHDTEDFLRRVAEFAPHLNPARTG